MKKRSMGDVHFTKRADEDAESGAGETTSVVSVIDSQRRRHFLKGTAAMMLVPGLGMVQTSFAANGVSRLVVGMNADMPIPDAHKTRAMVSHTVMKHVVECLISFDEDYKLIPQLAESWAPENGGATYVIKLRKGVSFHNGKEFSAEDAKYSIERLKDVSPNKGDYSDIVRVDIRDPYTIAVVLSAPSPILPAILAGPWGGYIMPKDLDKEQGGTINKPIGTGPFQWVQWDSGRRLIIKKYAQYKPDDRFPGPTGLGGKREALVDEIEFRVIPEGATRAIGLETGELDFSVLIDLGDYERLQNGTDVQSIEEKSFESVVLWLGVNQAPTNELKFRQAMAAAIDYDGVLAAALGGHGAVNNAFLHPDMKAWWSQSMTRRHKYDPARAKALLAQTAYKGQPLTIFASSSTEYTVNAALAIQQQLQAVGIKIDVRSLDSAGIMGVVYAREPNYNFGMTSISGRMDPDQVYYRRLHSGVAVNGYKNPVYDQLVDKARASMKQEERVALYGKAQDVVMDDIPAIVLFNVNFFNAKRKAVKGYKPNALGLPRFWNVTVSKA